MERMASSFHDAPVHLLGACFWSTMNDGAPMLSKEDRRQLAPPRQTLQTDLASLMRAPLRRLSFAFFLRM